MKLFVAGGIGNRLIPIVSALRICDIVGDKLELYWHTHTDGHNIPVKWWEYFNFPVTKLDKWNYSYNETSEFYDPNQEYYRTYKRLKFIGEDEYVDLNDYIDTILPINREGCKKYKTGIILRTKHPNLVPDVFSMLQNQKEFYLSTDSAKIKKALTGIECTNSIEEMIYDLMSISNCEYIKGTFGSTFSELCALYSRKEILYF